MSEKGDVLISFPFCGDCSRSSFQSPGCVSVSLFTISLRNCWIRAAGNGTTPWAAQASLGGFGYTAVLLSTAHSFITSLRRKRWSSEIKKGGNRMMSAMPPFPVRMNPQQEACGGWADFCRLSLQSCFFTSWCVMRTSWPAQIITSQTRTDSFSQIVLNVLLSRAQRDKTRSSRKRPEINNESIWCERLSAAATPDFSSAFIKLSEF